MSSEKIQRANQTRAQLAKVAHEKASKQRAQNQETLKSHYLAIKDEPAFQDILVKARAFVDYHTKMARDGVGSRKTGHKLQDGSSEIETVYYTNNKRVSELDKSAGILELLDYIERQTTPSSEQPQIAK